jgi:large subunit ribosomal protein L6
MSRIGRLPINIPAGVNVNVSGTTVTVKGPKGELKRTVAADMAVKLDNSVLTVERPSDEERHKALHGLTRSLLANMVEGVTKGYVRQLEISGVGYKAEMQPYGLKLALGYSHQIEFRAPAGIKLTATTPTAITIEGADKEVVGRVASEIRKLRKPEPYKGKGIRYAGEQVRRKAGKAGGK